VVKEELHELSASDQRLRLPPGLNCAKSIKRPESGRSICATIEIEASVVPTASARK